MSGYVAISRELWNDPDFDDAPMSQREAWIWMIAEAAWKPRKVRRGSSVISLERGQLAHSIRFMAEAWGWHKARVERFLKSLKNRDMIETATETGVSVITICNYGKYQSGDEATETPSKPKPRQHRDTTETNENQDNQDNQYKGTSKTLDVGDLDLVWDMWPAPGRKRSSRKEAEAAFKRVLINGANPDDVIRGARIYLTSEDARKEGGRFVPALHRWIAAERFKPWLEQPKPVQRKFDANQALFGGPA